MASLASSYSVRLRVMLALRCFFVPWLIRRVSARSSSEMLRLSPALLSSKASFHASIENLDASTTKYALSSDTEKQLKWGQVVGTILSF